MKTKTWIAIALILALAATSIGLVACDKKSTKNQDLIDEPLQAEGISLTVTRLAMTKGSETTLTYALTPEGATVDATYTSSDAAVASVNAQGVVTAVESGVATLTVRVGDKYAECRVVVGDLIVSKQRELETAEALAESVRVAMDGPNYTARISLQGQPLASKTTVVGGGQNTVFDSVQQAIAQAAAGQTIVVDEGSYDETLTIAKDLTLMGISNPRLRSATVEGAKVNLTNLSFAASEYPAEGSATLHVKSGGSATVTSCFFAVDSSDDLAGGYAVLADQGCGGLKLEDNTISNYRYGVYVCPTDKEIVIRSNRLSHLTTGIGVDLRQQNTDRDYPTTGQISGNQYNEVERHTQFLHYTETYDGELDFEDNEEENSSNGQSDTGGSGLLE
ncbi:MAG: Ig-like domain-containing protein [Clostridia bacterium]|nr:Ig-like domain-containing protein [Clostridia bacterium]